MPLLTNDGLALSPLLFTVVETRMSAAPWLTTPTPRLRVPPAPARTSRVPPAALVSFAPAVVARPALEASSLSRRSSPWLVRSAVSSRLAPRRTTDASAWMSPASLAAANTSNVGPPGPDASSDGGVLIPRRRMLPPATVPPWCTWVPWYCSKVPPRVIVPAVWVKFIPAPLPETVMAAPVSIVMSPLVV